MAAGLDFEIDTSPAPPATTAPQTATSPGAPAGDMDFDLDLSEMAESPENPPTPAANAPVAKPLDFDGISLDLDTPPDLQDALIEEAGELPTTDFGSSTQDFGQADNSLDGLDDLSDLSDLEAPEGTDGSNPLETKLSLAEEFDAIGDTEGARSLAEEVLAEASGDLAERARAFIARLG
jgi:pilus assembly protein FimV